MKHRAAWAVLSVLVSTVACSSSDAGGGGGGATVNATEAEYAAKAAELICKGFAACSCDAAEFEAANGVDISSEEACRTYVEGVRAQAQADDQQAGLVYDAECASRRLTKWSTPQCQTEAWDGTHCGSCQIYHGSVALGGACDAGSECGRGLTCMGGVCIDTCQPVALDGACESGVTRCVEGATCAGNTCVTAGALGDPCGPSSDDCGDGRFCKQGVCAVIAKLGEACVPGGCAASYCVEGTCQATSSVGTPNICSLY